jgi:hypothetical protein
MRFVALPVFLLAATPAAFAQEWTQLKTSDPNITFAIDLGSIERDGDFAMFRERLTYEKPEKVDAASGMLIREKLVHRIMDCKRKTQSMLSGSMRSESGTLIERVTFDRKQMVMAPIPAGSLAEKELELVCKAAQKPAAQ